MTYFDTLGERARKASGEMGYVTFEKQNDALMEIAHILEKSKDEILAVSSEETQNSRINAANGIGKEINAIDEDHLNTIIRRCKRLTYTPSPVGEVCEGYRCDDRRIELVRSPIGVIGVIFESNIDALFNSAIACIKTNNVVVLRCAREIVKTAKLLSGLVRTAISRSGIDKDAVIFVDDPDPTVVMEMMRANKYIDLLLPLGSRELVKAVLNNATVQVLKTSTHGVLYVDSDAKPSHAAYMAAQCLLSEVRTIFIHRDIADDFLAAFDNYIVPEITEIRGCSLTEHVMGKKLRPASDIDYKGKGGKGYCALKIVEDMADALENIQRYNLKGAQYIATENPFATEAFRARANGAAVFINVAPALSYSEIVGSAVNLGFAAGVGPIRLKELTRCKYVVTQSIRLDGNQ